PQAQRPAAAQRLRYASRFRWRSSSHRALLLGVIRSQHLLAPACSLVGILLWPSLAAATELPPPAQAPPVERPEEVTAEVLVEAPEPQYVAPTLRDRIGRIWAPVLINGKAPFRLLLDTGASHSAIIARVADRLGIDAQAPETVLLRGFTGS